MKRSDIKRFWSKVDRSGGPSACWPWKAGRDKDGYGKFATGKHRHQKHVRAHRVALQLKTKRTGRVARHWRCHNPPCCNPRHLRWGSAKDNRWDTVRSGREPRGEQKSIAKLTARKVLYARRAYAACERGRKSGQLIRRMAARLGVKPITLRAAISGRLNWKWLR